MKALRWQFHYFQSNPSTKIFPFKTNYQPLIIRKGKKCKVSIKPPPHGFDFRSEFLTESRNLIATFHPELLDLADNGSLVLIEKSQFGPVPLWRTEFIEPEMIWLIGTSHISPESASDVDRVVRSVKPENVVVELCRSRAGIMYTSNDGQLKSNLFSLTGNGFFRAIGRSINLGGQTGLAIRLLLAAFSSRISRDVNRPFGDEFRAARKASEEIGAQIVLGDRPIEITLERAWSSLKWSEKTNLFITLIRGITSSNTDVDSKTLKESNSDYSNFELYEKLSRSYPALLQPLIHERDTYIAWSLKRSKAVNRSKRVVGVVGKGHMNGVIYALVSDLGDLRFRDLVGERKSYSGSGDGWITDLVKNVARDTVVGIVLWELFVYVKSELYL